MLVGDLIIRNARRHPDKVAFIFSNTRYTFRKLNNRVNHLANALLSLGISKGDRIAVLADYGDRTWRSHFRNNPENHWKRKGNSAIFSHRTVIFPYGTF